MSLPILPTISTSCNVISAILVAIGWWQIAHRHVNTHKKVMLIQILVVQILLEHIIRYS